MATPGELMDKLASVTGSNRSTIESLYNGLRDADEIPKGARGKNALRVTSEHAAKLLIAVCCAEHVKDAANAVRRYSRLDANNTTLEAAQFPVPNARWDLASREFPLLGQLSPQHSFIDALVALIDSYVDLPEHPSEVAVSFGSPYPSATASVILQRGKNISRVSVHYGTPRRGHEEGHSDDPDFLTLIDPSKERQRRRFATLDGDLQVLTTITHDTLSALGELSGAK